MRKRRRCAAPASVPELSAGAGGDAIAAAFAEQQLLLIRAFCAPPPAVTLRSLAELSRAHSAMVDGTWTLECAGGAPRSAAAWLGGRGGGGGGPWYASFIAKAGGIVGGAGWRRPTLRGRREWTTPRGSMRCLACRPCAASRILGTGTTRGALWV